jgi:hypothetical protein
MESVDLSSFTGIGSAGSTYGEQQRDASLDAPTRRTGTEIVDFSSFTGVGGSGTMGSGGGIGGGQSVRLGTSMVELPTKQTGKVLMGTSQLGGVNDQDARGQQLRTAIAHVANKHTGMSPIDASTFGGVNDQNAEGQQLRTAIAHLPNKHSGVSSVDASSLGGVNDQNATGQQMYPLHFDAHTSKTGLGAMGEYSIGAGLAGPGPQGMHAHAASPIVTAQSRTGVDTISTSSHGSYGGVAAPHGQSAAQLVVVPTSKSGMMPSAGVPYGSGRVGAGGISEVGTVVMADSYNLRGKNKLEKLQSLYAAVQLQSSGAQTSVPLVTTFNGKKGEENSVRIPSGSLYGSENSGHGLENWAVSTQLDSKREHGYNAAAISPITDDSTRYLGHYNQTVETLNSRQFSNFAHPVASASMANFLQEREVCGL